MRWVAASLLAVATVVAGFTPRPLPGFPTGDDLVAASVVVSGSVCVTRRTVAGDDGVPTTEIVVRVCDACLLIAAPGLPAIAADDLAGPIDRPIGRVVVAEETASSSRPPSARARGPPGFVGAA